MIGYVDLNELLSNVDVYVKKLCKGSLKMNGIPKARNSSVESRNFLDLLPATLVKKRVQAPKEVPTHITCTDKKVRETK